MTDQALDELARRVLLDTARQEYGELMKEPPEHSFTPAFEKKMKKLLRRAKHPAWHKFAQAAASLLLVIFLTGCAVLAVSPEAREVFAGWVREVYENYFVYTYQGTDEGETDQRHYCPTWVPDGWQMTRCEDTGPLMAVTYKNGKGGLLGLVCFKDTSAAAAAAIDTSHADEQDIQVNGMDTHIYVDRYENGNNILIWTDEEEGLFFVLTGPLSNEEMVRIAESVEAVELETVYRPTWIPEGYVQQEEKPLYGQVNLEYRSENGAFIFIYIPDPDEGQPVYIDPTKAEQSQAQVNGRPAEVYIYDVEEAMNIILWSDESEAIFLITGTLTKDELIRVAESVETIQRVVPETERYVYMPMWVPEEYREVSSTYLEGQSVIWYKTEQKELLTVMYVHDLDAGELFLERGEAKQTSVSVHGTPADLYIDPEKDGANALVWQDVNSGFLFWICGPITGEELVRVAESMEPVVWPERVEEYRLAWVPGGYQKYQQGSPKDQSFGSVMYINGDGTPITLMYVRQAEPANLSIVPASDGRANIQTVQVNGCKADLYLGQDLSEANTLVWPDNDTGMLYGIQAHCSEEELIKMAESVELVPREYYPDWLPEGYELINKSVSDTGPQRTFFFENQDGEDVIFIYDTSTENPLYVYPNEGHVEKSVLVGGHSADLFLSTKEGLRSELYWSDPETGTLFIISGTLAENELLKMAESIRYTDAVQGPHHPTWIPEGYRNTSGSSNGCGMELNYKSADGKQLHYVYARVLDVGAKRAEIRAAVEGLELREVLVNGSPAELYESAGDVNHLVWVGERADEIYWIAAALPSEELIWMAESVGIVPRDIFAEK
jgi:hypothetical protein